MSSERNPTTMSMGAVNRAMGAVARMAECSPAGSPGMRLMVQRVTARMMQSMAQLPMRWSGLSL